ncbi:hypothetical protein HanXRQr2_Chr04g0164491 [Helianthus annuus]|uniref:Uncharacterized protein n=1 Tax=Helianthus annuus TaxID=4232 RepID=A0A9K3J7T9_HELAN|nr:hypothetical protein HanXRQr2_Chr04g0164491 [Helianthus annuus]
MFPEISENIIHQILKSKVMLFNFLFIISSKYRSLQLRRLTWDRTKAQLMPRKNWCRFTSLAPSRDPNRFFGSLCNNL